MKTLNDYFTMNYRMEIIEDKDEGGLNLEFHEVFIVHLQNILRRKVSA